MFLSVLLEATSTSESIFCRKLLASDLEMRKAQTTVFGAAHTPEWWGLLKCRSWDQAGILGREGKGLSREVEVNLGVTAEGQGMTSDVFLFRWTGQKHLDEQCKFLACIWAKKLTIWGWAAILAASLVLSLLWKSNVRKITLAALTTQTGCWLIQWAKNPQIPRFPCTLCSLFLEMGAESGAAFIWDMLSRLVSRFWALVVSCILLGWLSTFESFSPLPSGFLSQLWFGRYLEWWLFKPMLCVERAPYSGGLLMSFWYNFLSFP